MGSLIYKKIGPRLLLSTLVIAWGIVATAQGQIISRSFFSTLWSYLNVNIFRCSRICNNIRRSGHSEGLSWTSWRSPDSRYFSLTFEFLYTEGVVLQVRRRIAVLTSNHPSIYYLELPYFWRQLRCVLKCWVKISLSQVHSAGRCFFRFTLRRNREHGWNWRKTRMGLDLYSCTFWNFFQICCHF